MYIHPPIKGCKEHTYNKIIFIVLEKLIFLFSKAKKNRASELILPARGKNLYFFLA